MKKILILQSQILTEEPYFLMYYNYIVSRLRRYLVVLWVCFRLELKTVSFLFLQKPQVITYVVDS